MNLANQNPYFVSHSGPENCGKSLVLKVFWRVICGGVHLCDYNIWVFFQCCAKFLK